MALTKIKGAGINISAAEKLYFDGGGTTYIQESADGVLDFYADNVKMLELLEGGTDYVWVPVDATKLAIGAGKDLNIYTSSDDAIIENITSDKDIIFKGNDGGSTITALTLDISAAGAATFNDKIIATELDISGNMDIDGTSNLDVVDIDGALTQDGGNVVFNEDSGDYDFRVESNGSANMLFVDGGNEEVLIQRAASGGTATAGSVLIVEDDDNTEISLLGGSSSLLAINFGHSGDVDDGMITYNTTSGSEAMQFTTNAAIRATIDKDGKFGIGTASVDEVLHVYGTSNPAIKIEAPAGQRPQIISESGDETECQILFNQGATTHSMIQGGRSGNQTLKFYTGGTTLGMTIQSSGEITKPLQPAYSAVPASAQNIADGTADIAFGGTERFDQAGNYASNTFTAPATGKYQLQCNIRLDDLKADVSYYSINLVTSNKTYLYVDMIEVDSEYNYRAMQGALLVDMDTNDTAKWTVTQSGGTDGASIQTDTTSTGFLVC